MSMTRVLLVEDEPGYARFLREVLAEVEESAYQITWAATLEEGLAALARQKWDAILLDLGLPDADGIEALEQIAAAAPSTPLVVLSARHDLDVALESMRRGAQEYLVKGQAENVLLPRAIRYAVERKHLQDAAAAARREAERANAVKDEFLAMLGHELRNPLAPIVTAIALMHRRDNGQSDRERAIVERQVNHLVRLVDDLLDVSRIARGKLELTRAPLDLAEVVPDAVEICRPLLDARGHRMEIQVPSGLLFVEGDRARLVQVVANLLTNAGKYMHEGGEILLAAGVEGAEAVLRVRDRGIGMDRDLLERVFDMFEQGRRSADRSAGGLGLGLAIVRSIVTMHGGSVSAASEGPDKGSEFTVRLPLIAARPRAPAPAPAPAPQPGSSPLRLLVVDDNADVTEMFEAYLRAQGHLTAVANEPGTALRLARSAPFDVAFIDIGLPTVDGHELARRIRAELGPRTPLLVAVTGYGQEADRSRSRQAGFEHHLVKPVDFTSLDRILSSVRLRV